MFSRREILRGTSALFVGARVGPAGLLAIGPCVPAEAAVQALAVMAAVGAALQTVSSMLRSKESGADVLLSAMDQKLDIVIRQLALVQQSLAHIIEKIDAIPDEVDELLQSKYVRDKIAVMKGAIGKYAELQNALINEMNNYGKIVSTDDSIRSEVKEIYSRFDGARRELAASDENARPDAALFVPVAFIFELAMRLVSTDSLERIIELLRGYEAWLRRTVDPKSETSTVGFTKKARESHDALLKKAAETALGKALKLPSEINDPISGDYHCQYGESLVSQKPFTFAEILIFRRAEVSLKLLPISENMTAQLINVSYTEDEKPWTIYTNHCIPGPNCQPTGDPWPTAEMDRLRKCPNKEDKGHGLIPVVQRARGPQPKQVITSSAQWTVAELDRKLFNNLVDQANGQRMAIGMYSAIFATAVETRQLVVSWMERLGG